MIYLLRLTWCWIRSFKLNVLSQSWLTRTMLVLLQSTVVRSIVFSITSSTAVSHGWIVSMAVIFWPPDSRGVEGVMHFNSCWLILQILVSILLLMQTWMQLSRWLLLTLSLILFSTFLNRNLALSLIVRHRTFTLLAKCLTSAWGLIWVAICLV